MQLIIHAQPAVDPIELDDAKDILKPDSDDDDAVITGLIKSATREAEVRLRRKLVTQTWDMALDRFPCDALQLPFPVQSVVVQYYDVNEQLQTWDASNYYLDIGGLVQRITPKMSWPVAYCRPQAVKIRMVAGYGSPAKVPETIKNWIKLYLRHIYYDGNSPDSFRADGLLDTETVPMVA